MAFVHLHVHSQYTLLDGVIQPVGLVKKAKSLGQSGIALTDRCNLFGAVEFFKACKGEDIHPILGAEIAVQPEGISFLDPKGAAGGWDLLFLVMNETGYKNLCYLITTAIFEGMHYRPRIDLKILAGRLDGLIVLTACHRGPVGRSLFPANGTGDPDTARKHIRSLKALFPQDQVRDRLFLELQDNGMPHQGEINALSRTIAEEESLLTVVTNSVYYLEPEDAVTQDTAHCIATGQALDSTTRLRIQTDQLYLKSEAELKEVFPDDHSAIERTQEISDRCDYKMSFGKYHFPATTPPDPDQDTQRNWEFFSSWYPPPLDFGAPPVEKPVEGAGTLDGYFRWFARVGLEHRLLDVAPELAPAYHERLEMELNVIIKMGFAAYFLIVAEFINWAKDNGIPVGPGRGSAAGALCAWAMRITDIDSIRFDLLFERFLNPERVSMPDIDVDFCQDRREEAITHVREKYGQELVSQIITYGKLQAKAAVRDVARSTGLLFSDGDRIAKLIPNELSITIEKALLEPALAELVGLDARVRRVMNLAQRVEGICRQTGVHAAGVVISDRPLVEYAPLYCLDPADGAVCQFDGKSVETIGLIKFDFLGLKTLDQIRDALAMVKRNTGEHIDLSRIPLDDPATFKLLQGGDAFGVFQVESSGMRELLVRLAPHNLDELVALVALYRPGPLKSGMVDDFIERKHGRTAVTYLDPRLEDVLKGTYGVVVYQEQVMQTARVLAGYSLGDADLLRRAMGKKNAVEMGKQKTRFVDGARERGVEATRADNIFGLLEKFAEYGFNKSHSAAYGVIAYHTAWLKTHHRAEYMSALMSIESADSDKVLAYINDCRRAGLKILPPDINESLAGFDVPKGSDHIIRFGLAAVKGVGEAAVESILAARKAVGGRFSSLEDFLEQVDGQKCNKRVLEALIRCGAFDWTGLTRNAMVEGLDGCMKTAARAAEERNSGQVSLFGAFGGSSEPAPSFRFPDLAEWPTGQKMAFEKEALGFYISGHPLDNLGEDLKRIVTCTLGQLEEHLSSKEISVGVIVTGTRMVKTRKGDRMAILTLEDPTGTVNCVFFPENWNNSRAALTSGAPVLISGKADRRDDELQIVGDRAERLSVVLERRSREVRLFLQAEELQGEQIEALATALESNHGPCEVRIELTVPGVARAVLKLPADKGVVADEALRDRLETLFRRQGVARFS